MKFTSLKEGLFTTAVILQNRIIIKTKRTPHHNEEFNLKHNYGQLNLSIIGTFYVISKIN